MTDINALRAVLDQTEQLEQVTGWDVLMALVFFAGVALMLWVMGRG